MAAADRRSLALLCAVEFCERFAGYVLLALFVLYLDERVGLPAAEAARVAGYVTALAYAACIAGGLIADRWLGPRRSVALGICTLGLSYAAVALDVRALLVPAAAVWIVGNGLFKPSITVLVGGLYAPGDPRRAIGFTWFYYAVNAGAVLAPLVGGTLRTERGWASAFAAAALAMAAALGVFAAFARAPAIVHPEAPAPAEGPSRTVASPGALLVVMLALAALGIALTQTTSTLLLFARDCTRRTLLGRSVPPDFFAALPSAVVLALTPLLSAVWRGLRARKKEPPEPHKLALGLLLCAAAYAVMVVASVLTGDTAASPLWLIACKIIVTLGEMIAFPVGLSLASTLAPPKMAGLSLGLSFGAHALGYWLGGEIGGLWTRWPHDRFFGLLVLGSLVAAALVGLVAESIARSLAGRAGG